MASSLFDAQTKDMLIELAKCKWKYDHYKSCLNGSRSFKELFSIILDLQGICNLLVPSLLRSEKNEGRADTIRRDGNELFRRKNYIDALDRYNSSILYSPHPVIKSNEASVSTTTPEGNLYSGNIIAPEKYGGISNGECKALAMGYANRSAVLLKLKMYDKCLRDIDLAVRYGYPEAFRNTLEDRRLRCQKAKETPISEEVTSGETATAVSQETDTLSHDFLRLSMLSGNQQLMDAVMSIDFKAAENQAWKNLMAVTEVAPPALVGPNSKIPSLSHGLKVSVHPTKGRSIISTRYIRPGEVLAVERAYCVSIHEGSILTYCSSCLSFCMVPLPCPGCSKVIFCSETCRIKYLEEDHWLECAIRPSIIVLGLQNRNLAYKILKNFSFHQLVTMLDELQNEKHESPETFGFDNHGVYSSTSYQSIHYLQADKEKTKFETLFSAGMLAFALTKILGLSERFFIDESGKPLQPSKEDFVTAGAVILANILKIHNNSRVIHNYKLEKPIASAIFPALSLVNHDCSPSAYAYHRGRMRILRAIKPIQPGEEVTYCYSMTFHEQELESRRKSLETIGFTCNCKACEGHWPMFSKLPIYEIKSDTDVTRQDRSQILQRISSAVVLSYKVRNKLINNEQIPKEEFESLCEATEMMFHHVVYPCQNICNLQLALTLCFHTGF